MEMGVTPSETVTCLAWDSSTNFANQDSRFRPLSSTRSAACAFFRSEGVGSYSWISAPGLVRDSTFRSSPATLRAMSASTVKVVSTVFLPLLLLAPSVVLEVLPQPVSTSSRVSARAAQSAWTRRRALLPAGVKAFMRHPSLEVTGLSMWLMYGICRAGTLGTRLCLRRHHNALLPVVPGGI